MSRITSWTTAALAALSAAIASPGPAPYKSGEINAIYDKWFMKPIPPKSINLNVPMGASFKKVVDNPTDSGDPAAY